MEKFITSALVITLVWSTTPVFTKGILDEIRRNPNLSEFSQLLNRSREATSLLEVRQATVFAPTNDAIQDWKDVREPLQESLVLYHMTNLAKRFDKLEEGQLNTELEGNAPLWITKRDQDVYVNNAKIVRQRSDIHIMNDYRKEQVLHVIDRVLEPAILNPPDSALYNPDAQTFLERFPSFPFRKHSILVFSQKVRDHKKLESIYGSSGKNTFFIPVGKEVERLRQGKIDDKVIDGHVIPNHVLFTRTTHKNDTYITLAYVDNLRVNISMWTDEDEKTSVNSNTIVGDASHPVGVVPVEIIRGNIPVSNGVIHLINRPLMVVDNTVHQFLQKFEVFNTQNGKLSDFYSLLRFDSTEVLETIVGESIVTVFAPSNQAFRELDPKTLDNIKANPKKLGEMLRLHFVLGTKLMTHEIRESSGIQMFDANSAAANRKLYFLVIGDENNRTITVEGGGVNATIVEPDITAVNGVVHIIDRILGIPYTTIYQKLKSDPLLSATFHLGEQKRFNIQLDESKKRFTYFVPNNYAWRQASQDSPSAYKKLFMSDFASHANSILERHLIVGESLTMSEIQDRLNSGIHLNTVRDNLKINITQRIGGYSMKWMDGRAQPQWFNVKRADIECTNGIIHVIDRVLLNEDDVQVSGTTSLGVSLLANLAVFFAIKFLL